MALELQTSLGHVQMKVVVGRNSTNSTLKGAYSIVSELMSVHKKLSSVYQSTFQNFIKKYKALGIEVVPKEGKKVGNGEDSI
jgi:hypothetical protein